MERIVGEVTGVDFSKCKVVVYSLGGETWFIQPFVRTPYTQIDEKGRWETRTHLGSRYAALVVSAEDYSLPAESFALPTRGDTVLAITEVPAGGGAVSDESSSAGRGLFSFANLQLLFIAFIVILCLGAFDVQAKQFTASMSELLGDLLLACRKLFNRMWTAMVAWLKTTPDEAQPQGDQRQIRGVYPVPVLKGLLALTIASIGACADYSILVESVVVVFPLKAKAWLMALILVACKALVGVLLHSLTGRVKRFCLVSLLILLSLTDGYLAYLRTVAIEDSVNLISVAEVVPDSGGSLIIEGQDSSSAQDQAARSVTNRAAKEGSLRFSPDALLAALVATLCALAETLGVYAAFMLAGHALAWLVAAFGLIPVGLLYATSWLATECKLADRLGIAIQAIISALGFIGKAALKALGLVLRTAWNFLGRLPRRAYEIWQEWKRDLLRRRFERKQLKADLQNRLDLALLGHRYGLQQSETEWQGQINQTTLEQQKLFEERDAALIHQGRVNAVGRDRELAAQEATRNEEQVVIEHLKGLSSAHRDAVSESLTEVLNHLKKAVNEVGQQAANAIVGQSAEKREEYAKHAADSLNEGVSSLLRKNGEAFTAVDGDHKRLKLWKWFSNREGDRGDL